MVFFDHLFLGTFRNGRKPVFVWNFDFLSLELLISGLLVNMFYFFSTGERKKTGLLLAADASRTPGGVERNYFKAGKHTKLETKQIPPNDTQEETKTQKTIPKTKKKKKKKKTS